MIFMKVVTSVKEMQEFSALMKSKRKSIGFVPTMGFLHEGHASLIRKSVQENDSTVASIFVNPLQFAPNEDFNSYPRDFERDKKICLKEKVDVLFYPNEKEIYPNGAEKAEFREVSKFTAILEGKTRPVHFRGVTTVVSKLFDIVMPNKAYFGKKDFQQAKIIDLLAKEFNYNVEIIKCPIVREKDGLALSSRNVYLNENERKQAPILFQSLLLGKKLVEEGEKNPGKVIQRIKEKINSMNSAEIDYVEILDLNSFEKSKEINSSVLILLAVYFGKTRLIDNLGVLF